MPPRKLGAFKRAMAHIDEHWFKKLLVKMTDEEIRAARKFRRQGNSGNQTFPMARKLRRIRQKGYSGGEEIQAAIVS